MACKYGLKRIALVMPTFTIKRENNIVTPAEVDTICLSQGSDLSERISSSTAMTLYCSLER